MAADDKGLKICPICERSIINACIGAYYGQCSQCEHGCDSTGICPCQLPLVPREDGVPCIEPEM